MEKNIITETDKIVFYISLFLCSFSLMVLGIVSYVF